MKYLFLLTCILISLHLQAQTEKELIGKWKLVKFSNEKGKEKDIKKVYKTDEVYQIFNEDHKFTSIIGDKEFTGTWKLTYKNKILDVKVDVGSARFKVVYADAKKRIISTLSVGKLEYIKVEPEE